MNPKDTPIVYGERRRVRLHAMANELQISDRKFRELLVMGLPYTQLQGILWFEPSKVHAWLDKFNRTGRPPGTKRTKGVKLPRQDTVE